MKVVPCICLALLAAVHAARATIVLSDTFSYPDGNLADAAGSVWMPHSGTTAVTVTNGEARLTFANSQDVNALLSGGPYTTNDTTTLYCSFKIRFSALPTLSGSYFAHFKDDIPSGQPQGFTARIWSSTANAASGKFRLGVANGSSGNATTAQVQTDLSLDTVYTVVTRYVPATGIATIWLDPNAESDPSVTATDIGTAAQPNEINVFSYAFRQAGGIGTMWIDNLRVGTLFADVAGANNPPSISPIEDQHTRAGLAVGPISFTIGDAETSVGSLTLSKSSTNTALVPDSNIVFGGSGSNRTVTITPAGNAQGRTQITLSVSDGSSTNSISFLVSVGFPTISAIPDQETAVNSSRTISFTIGDSETPAGSLALSAASSNPALVSDVDIAFGGSGSNRTATVTPAMGQQGITTITLTVSDGEVTTQESFELTVYPVFGIINSDDFNRPDGPLVDGFGRWSHADGTNGDMRIENQQVKLSFALSEDVYTDLTGGTFVPYAPASGTILYSSFTVSFLSLPGPSGSYFAHNRDETLSGFRCRVFANTANAAAGKFRLGIANFSQSLPLEAQFPRDLSTGVTYVVITKYNVATGQSTLWVDPVSESDTHITAVDNPSRGSVWFYALRQTGGIGRLYFDNLNVGGSFASVLIPRLQINKPVADVHVSWPAAAADYRLEATTSLSPENWGAVTQTPQIIGDRKVVTIDAPAGDRFFRLVKP